MAQETSKKIGFFIGMTVIFGINGGLLYLSDTYPEINREILFLSLGISWIIVLLWGMRLTRVRNAVFLDETLAIDEAFYNDKERHMKQEALQAVFNDLDQQNWAGLIAHCRDRDIANLLSDYAEITAHPTKRYCRLATQDYELKVAGYESKSHEIMVKRDQKLVLSEDATTFETLIKEIKASLLEFYHEWMVDPLHSLELLREYANTGKVALIFRYIVKFADIFHEPLFKVKISNTQWGVRSTLGRSQFQFSTRAKKYRVRGKFDNEGRVTSFHWEIAIGQEFDPTTVEGPLKVFNQVLDQFAQQLEHE